MLYFGLILEFVLEYVRPGDMYPGLKPLNRLNAILPMLLLMATLAASGGIRLGKVMTCRNMKLLWFYLSLFFLSIFTARVTMNAVTKFEGVLGYIFLAIILVKNVDRYSRLRGLFACLVFINLYVLLKNPQVALSPSQRHYLQAGYFLGDGNDFALSVNIAIPLGLFLLVTSKKLLARLVYGAAVGFLVLGVIGTQSRGGSLGLAAVLLYYWWTSKKRARWGILLGTGVVVLLAYASQSYLERMGTLSDYEQDSSAQARLDAWAAARRMAWDHPLTGVGAGGFATAYGMFYRPPGVGRTDRPWHNAHSIYFQLLGELGYPGFVMLIYMIVSNLIRTHKRVRALGKEDEDELLHRRVFVAVNGSLLAFGVSGAFLTAIYYPHIFVCLALIASAELIWEASRSPEDAAAAATMTPTRGTAGRFAARGTR